MKKEFKLSMLVISLILITIGCTNKENEIKQNPQNEVAIDIKKEEKINIKENMEAVFLLSHDVQKKELSLNISELVNKGRTNYTLEMHVKIVRYNEDTTFINEKGLIINPKDFKIGEKLTLPKKDLLNPNSDEIPLVEKVVQLEMSKKEKLDRLLSKREDDLHTVILYEENTAAETLIPYDVSEFENHTPELFNGGISWIEYKEGLAIDYKKELNVEKLPLIMLFDQEKMVFKTEKIEELKKWLEENR